MVACFRIVLVLCVTFALTGCATCSIPLPEDISELETVHFADNSTPGKILLLVPGLNMNPAVLVRLSDQLRKEAGIATRIVPLTGHKPPYEEDLRAADWETDLNRGIEASRRQYPHARLYVLGFSLGGLLAIRAMQSDGERPASAGPDTAILAGVIAVAPPLALTRLAAQVEFLTELLPRRTLLRSFASSKVRLRSSIPLGWYAELDTLRTSVIEQVEHLRNSSTPLLVVLNPVDELVHFEESRTKIEALAPQQFEFLSLRHEPDLSPEYEHVMVTPEALGEIGWATLIDRVVKFVSRH